MSDDARDASRGAIEAAKRDNLGQLLLQAARLYDAEARRRLAASGGMDLRGAQARLFPHIDWEGTRLTDLAARVGVTKQAVGQSVSELEAEGIVTRRRDPADGRARKVFFTARGRRAIVRGLGALGGLEADCAARMSAREIAALKRSLARVIAILEADASSGEGEGRPR